LCLYNILRLIRARFLSKQKQVNHYYQDARVVNQLAFDWLEELKASRFFLFLHYMDPHDPYFAHPYNGEGIARVSTPNPNPDQAEEIAKLYDGEVSYLDHHFGKLIDFLKREELYEDTLIIFTADHGEEFFEHGGWWHGLTLYDEQIYIPLIIKYPKGQNKGTVKTEIVRTLDIAPTILDYINSQVPITMQGTSLLKEYHLRSSQDQRVFSEENHENNILQSVRSDTWKFIRANQNNPRGLSPQELYNIAEDPEEKKNKAASKRERTEQMEAEINSYLDFAKGQSAQEEVGTIDQTTEDRLRALGYVD
jgi:arylsulfatase A-like enzyme